MSSQPYLLFLNPNKLSILKLKQNDRLFINSKTTKGHPKIIEECFENIQPGDIVYFSEGEPSSAILAEGVVLRGINKQIKTTKKNDFKIEGIEIMFNNFIGPVPYNIINNLGIFKINGLDKHFKKGLKEERLVKITNQQEGEINRLSDMHELTKEMKMQFVNNLLNNMRNVIEISIEEEMSNQFKHLDYLLREIHFKQRKWDISTDYDEDTINNYIKQGYYYITRLHYNRLSGTIIAKDGEVMIPVTIESWLYDDQKEFEEDLRGLIKQILEIKSAMDLRNITLLFKFSPDAKLRLPNWFFALCEKYGIRIQDITERKDIDTIDSVDTDDVPF